MMRAERPPSGVVEGVRLVQGASMGRSPIVRLAGSGGPSERTRPWRRRRPSSVRCDAVEKYLESGGVMEAPVFQVELPASVPLRQPRLTEPLHYRLLGDQHGLTFEDDVDPLRPGIAASGEDDAGVGAKVRSFLLIGAGGEVERLIRPDCDERRDVWSAIGGDRREPEELSLIHI